MPAIDLTKKVKEKLDVFITEEGCKTYSEAVNLLLEMVQRTKFERFKKE